MHPAAKRPFELAMHAQVFDADIEVGAEHSAKGSRIGNPRDVGSIVDAATGLNHRYGGEQPKQEL